MQRAAEAAKGLRGEAAAKNKLAEQEKRSRQEVELAMSHRSIDEAIGSTNPRATRLALYSGLGMPGRGCARTGPCCSLMS